MNRRRQPVRAADARAEALAVAQRFEFLTGRRAAEASLLEIGFGARPFRAFALQTAFKSVVAVDLDQPIFGWREIPAALRTNGMMRAVKGAVRSVVFDRGEWPSFHSDLVKLHPGYDPNKTRLVVSDAGNPSFWAEHPGPYDFVYSVDVFEHIPVDILRRILVRIREHLVADGAVVTEPCIFTGITGGHDPDWYPHRISEQSGADAWRHLTDPQFTIDTYLNRLTRRQYVELFKEAGFGVIRDEAHFGRLGEQHLTLERRADLAEYDDYELFSNRVYFALKLLR